MKKLFTAIALLAATLCPTFSAQAWDTDNAELPKRNILHCFSWPIKDIIGELDNIKAAGFGAIQISPMQRPDINEGWTWYTIYLPYDYHAYSSPGMGSLEDLKTLCEQAHKRDINIIVDVAINHVNKTKPYYNPWFEKDGRFREWGGNGSNIDYDNRWSITHNRLGDYVELNTENSDVIARAKAYMEELKDLGVDGIRFDAAKHIELPSEVTQGCGTQGVWPAVTSVDGLFYYGEIVGDCVNGNDNAIKEYAKYIWVPDNTYSTRAARENDGVPDAHAGGRDSMAGAHLIYWAESHDDYSNDEWSEKLDQSLIDRAYCALACRNKQAALYFSRPRARGKDNIKIEKGSTSYMSKQVVEVNKFRDAMQGREDYFSYKEEGGNKVASITRKDGGAVIVSKNGNAWVSIANGGEGKGYCPTGEYIDRVSGNPFTVTETTISGTVGPTGVAVLYKDNNPSTPLQTVTITGSKVYNVAYAGNFSNGNNYIYYWNSTNSNYSHPEWPGVRMERALGDDGKYYWCYDVPAGADRVIFNNGLKSDAFEHMQSGDLTVVSDFIMDNSGATIIPVTFQQGSFATEPVKQAKTVTIDGDYNIAYSGKFTHIYFWTGTNNFGNPWPGKEMTEIDGDDNQKYRCYKVPAGTQYVIFNDGNASGAEQTGDLAYTRNKVMCESGATEINVKFRIPGSEDETTITEEPAAINVVWPTSKYCYFAGDWSTPKAWAWISASDKTNCGSKAGWPGDAMTKTAGKYFWKASNNSVGLIIFSDDGEGQTKDLAFENGATYYSDGGHIGGDDYVYSNPNSLFMLGSFEGNIWNTSSEEYEFTKIDNKGIYVIYNVTLVNDNNLDGAKFNISSTTGTSWDDLNGKAVRFGAANEDDPITTNTPTHITRYENNEAGNCKSWKTESGTYDIIVDLYDMTVTLLKPQTAPTVEAVQLLEVQKNTADIKIKDYDYLTYPIVNNKVSGVKVNGENITVTELSNMKDDIFHDSNNVLFTEKALVTTNFTSTDGYNLDIQNASIGTKQSDGKFRGIISLKNLKNYTFISKVNYYYTLRQGVDVKVPMVSPAGTATLQLAVPEPRIKKHSISIEKSKSGDTREFSYEGHTFDALYHTAKSEVTIDPSNITDGLREVAGTLYGIKIDGRFVDENSDYSAVISPDYFLTEEYSPVELVTYGNEVGTGRWEAGDAAGITSIAMTYDAPVINAFNFEYYTLTEKHVDGGETHWIEDISLSLDATATNNSLTINGETLRGALSHDKEGDWYLVEFYLQGNKIASTVVEGYEGKREFSLIRDLGIATDTELTNGLYGKTLDVYVSTLYPFDVPAPKQEDDGRRNVTGSQRTTGMVETNAAIGTVLLMNDISTGIDLPEAAADGETTYYNLQGIRVANPGTPGIYVVRDAVGNARKVVVK